MVTYRIFPSIGIARLGENDNFFLGPEIPGNTAGELKSDGSTLPVTNYKDATSTKIRKQGARFHIFESNDGVNWTPAVLPDTATVTWKVTLENKKAGVTRDFNPPISPIRPQVPTGNESLVIKGGEREVSGSNATSASFKGLFQTTAANGTPFSVDVELGQLRTDAQGRLIVLGGKGDAGAPAGEPIGSFPNNYYKNPKWYDDVSDGPVTAEIQLTPNSAPLQAEGGAWVIVGPPDYAPAIHCVVTLYDVLRQVGIDEFGVLSPGIPSFDLDIAPILSRIRRLRWVHDDATWSDSRLSNPNLRSTDVTHQPLRVQVRNLVLAVESILEGHTNPQGPPFRLRAYQKAMLNEWAAGSFDNTSTTPPAVLSSEGLTRAALDGAAGQGFCPGIEAGIIVLDKTLYREPFDFRIDHASVNAGDLTALMAQPWQADFLKCHTEWWPTQRPDLAPQADGTNKDWIRGARTHRRVVERHGRLGIIVQQGANEVFVEMERDLTLSELE